MSARQRFVAGGPPAKQVPKSPGGHENSESATLPRSTQQGGSPLKDASNSPRPGGGFAAVKAENKKIDTENTAAAASEQTEISSRLFAGTDKPLNVGSLLRPRPRKGVESSTQNKKDKTQVIARLKENEPLSRIRSPKPSLAAAFRPVDSPASGLFSSSNATLLSDGQDLGSPRQNNTATYPAQSPSVNMRPNNNRRDVNSNSSAANPFIGNGLALVNDFASSISQSHGRSLESMRREVFPMTTDTREPAEQAHTFDSATPPSDQRLFSQERSYDFQAPINVDGSDDENNRDFPHNHGQRTLRRAHKRIVRHDMEDEENIVRQGKRSRVNSRSQEVTHENRARPSRRSTPAPQNFRTPTPVDTYRSQQFRQDFNVPPEQQPEVQVNENNEAFCRLLGVDLAHYLSEHLDLYEAAKKRWTDCTIEEWKAGADEMSGKFSKLIGLVKDHMNAKLEFYSSLHEKVAQHKTTLTERQTTLKKMQDKLVKDSGAVLGSNASAIN